MELGRNISRGKASLIHLSVSSLAIISLATMLSCFWYPPPYAWAMGGLSLIVIFGSVDICLGPLLTLIVWDTRKASLKFDMSVIVLLQALGMGYGIYSIFMARPVYLVFAASRFELVSAAAVPEDEMEKSLRDEFKALSLTGPKLVAAKPPDDIAERNRLTFSVLSGGTDLYQLPRYYVPYAELATEAARKAKPLGALTQRDAATRDKLSAYLSSHDLNPAKVKFLPMRAKAHDQTVLVDADTGAVLGIVNIDPWVQ